MLRNLYIVVLVVDFNNKKKKFEVKDKNLVAGGPSGSRGCDPLFQSPPHMHARPINSSSSDRAGLREATEGVVGAVECLMTGAFVSP